MARRSKADDEDVAYQREGGFIVLHRQVFSWSLWHFLSPEQRMVWITLLLAANWRDSKVWIGTRCVTVGRGQLLDSERTIARRAGVGRQVVRTTVGKLLAEGAILRSPVFHNISQNLTQNLTHKSTQPPHIITIVNYSKYQDVPDRANPTANPLTNQSLTQSEQGEPEKHDPPVVPLGVWAVARARLEAKLRGDLFARWFAPLTAHEADGVLTLVAPTQHHRDFVRDNYLDALARLLTDIGAAVRVEVVSRQQEARA